MSSSEEVASTDEKVTSPPAPAAPCAGCRRLRRKCVPDCVFAPYFKPEDGDRFDAVHSIFGASNVSKLLAELEPEKRAFAVESLVYQAMARKKDPKFGYVSYISILRGMLNQANDDVAAAREELAQHVGPAAAFQPFDPAAAPPLAKQMGETQLAATLQLSKEKDHAMRAMREEDEALPKLAEKDAVAKRMGSSVSRGHGQKQAIQQIMLRQVASHKQKLMLQQAQQFQNQQTALQMAEEAKSDTAAEQDVMMQVARQAAAEERYYNAAIQYAAMGYDDASLGHQLPHPQMAQAQQLAAADGATIMPFLPGWSANADAFLVQQQPQPQTVNAFGSQVEHSLPPPPPSLADSPRQQQNDGGDAGQSSDLTARSGNQNPNLPPDGRQ